MLAVLRLALTSASIALQQPSITVGPNVQVSVASKSIPHYEVLAAADPDHAGRMIACGYAQHHNVPRTDNSPRTYTAQHCYVTFDTGRTWAASLKGDRFNPGDPAAVYGRGDTVLVGVLGSTDSSGRKVLVYRSVDAGRTWQDQPAWRPYMDREYLVIDRTGKHPGRIYMHGTGFVRGIDTLGSRGLGGLSSAAVRLYTSIDGGTTFQGPIDRVFLGYGLGAENSSTVLTDGTFASFFAVTRPTRSQGIPDNERQMPPNAALYVV